MEDCCGPAPKVLSIQSHVVYGYVGNRAAVFPLQYLGFNVSFINSVQFSNHTHYPNCQGEVLEEDELKKLVDGLVSNGLTCYDYLITGYCRSVSFLREIRKTVELLRTHNPNMRYVCDPVLGDQGRFYCPAELADLFRTEILPLADVVTPNQFEMEVLSGVKIATEADVIEGLNCCHKIGVKTVVLSSCQLEGRNDLVAYVSDAESKQRFRVSFPLIPSQFTGTGDLFTSMLVAYMHKFPGDISAALERAISVCQDLLSLTRKCHEKQMTSMNGNGLHVANSEFEGVSKKALPWAALELRLIEGRHLLESSNPRFKAEPVP